MAELSSGTPRLRMLLAIVAALLLTASVSATDLADAATGSTYVVGYPGGAGEVQAVYHLDQFGDHVRVPAGSIKAYGVFDWDLAVPPESLLSPLLRIAADAVDVSDDDLRVTVFDEFIVEGEPTVLLRAYETGVSDYVGMKESFLLYADRPATVTLPGGPGGTGTLNLREGWNVVIREIFGDESAHEIRHRPGTENDMFLHVVSVQW